MAKNNKHKAHGAPKKPVKEIWWTPERIKAAVAVCVVLVIAAIGIGIYKYVDGKQDSVVGQWEYDYISSDTEEEMRLVFTFNADKTCGFVRWRSGEQEAEMSGQYSIDESLDYLTMLLGDDLSDISYYTYTCKKNVLTMTNVDNGFTYTCNKITE